MDELPQDLGELIRRTQAGSREDGKELYERCRNLLLMVICAVLPKRLRTYHDPRELLDETWLALRGGHAPDDALADQRKSRRYLKTIAENTVYQALRWRRKKPGQRVPLDDKSEPCSHELPAELALRLKELLDEHDLDHLTAQLPLDLQAVVPLLREGCKPVEITRRLGLHPKRVYWAIQRLFEKLAD